MTRINREEYEVLKGLDDKWKWIAKIRGMGLVAFDIAPKKYGNSKDWAYARSSQRKELDRNLLQFVEYDDDYPYNIAELIEEYEYSTEHVTHVVNERVKALGKAWSESEETEVKKDIEWFVDKWTKERNKTDVHDPMYHFINEFIADVIQLDEPEVLSQKWIDKNKRQWTNLQGTKDYIEADKLKNLLVPKPDLSVVPKFVADYIEECKNFNELGIKSLYTAMDSMPKEVSEWMTFGVEGFGKGQELFARAWLDGYTVEEEQKYYLKIGNLYLAEPLGDMTSDIIRMTRDKEVAYQFTDEKSIATHLDKFEGIEAVKVEELGE